MDAAVFEYRKIVIFCIRRESTESSAYMVLHIMRNHQILRQNLLELNIYKVYYKEPFLICRTFLVETVKHLRHAFVYSFLLNTSLFTSSESCLY
jgi:hypothetical protein